MNVLSTFLLSTTSIATLSFIAFLFQNNKKIQELIEQERRLIENILTSSKSSWKKVGTVKDIVYYPLKSGRGKPVEQCEFGERGISKNQSGAFPLKDRMFLVYDEKTREFQTGRQHSKLLLVNIYAVDENHAQLEVKDMPTLVFKLPRSTDENVKVVKCSMWFSEVVEFLDCGTEASEWLSKFLSGGESNLRLGLAFDGAQRKLKDSRAWIEYAKVYSALRNEDSGLFSDLASYMLISEASVEDLNSRLKKPVQPLQFRPNVIVKDCEPHAEDQWEWIKIGSQVVIRNFKPCTRCLLITVDPHTGIADPQYEPLKTLRTYRKLKDVEKDLLENHAPPLGVYCGLYQGGEVRVGDDLFVYQSVE